MKWSRNISFFPDEVSRGTGSQREPFSGTVMITEQVRNLNQNQNEPQTLVLVWNKKNFFG